jgi:mono/diheme cytochrome c family protein
MKTLKPFSALFATALLAACGGSPKPEPTAEALAPAVETEASKIERGRYLVGIMGCNDCHSPKLMGPQGPYLDPDRILSGYPADRPLPPMPANNDGWALMAMDLTAAVGPWGTTFAANITSDETGIGNWTYEQFERALRHGLYKGLEGSRPLLPPMPWQNMVDMKAEDMQAMFAYLKSTKPVENVVPAPVPPGAKAS